MSDHATKHPFHMVNPSPWPALGAFSALVLAIGYEDNCILLCRLTDAAELLVRRPHSDEGTITSMAWDASGKHMLFGTSEGQAGLLTLP